MIDSIQCNKWKKIHNVMYSLVPYFTCIVQQQITLAEITEESPAPSIWGNLLQKTMCSRAVSL